MQKYFKKIYIFFAYKKLKKTPQKIAYLWHSGGFFSLQNSPELHFCFILIFFIQPSLLESEFNLVKEQCVVCTLGDSGFFRLQGIKVL